MLGFGRVMGRGAFSIDGFESEGFGVGVFLGGGGCGISRSV